MQIVLTDGESLSFAAAVEDAEATSDEELNWTRHQEPAKSPTAVYSVRIPVERIEELRQRRRVVFNPPR